MTSNGGLGYNERKVIVYERLKVKTMTYTDPGPRDPRDEAYAKAYAEAYAKAYAEAMRKKGLDLSAAPSQGAPSQMPPQARRVPQQAVPQRQPLQVPQQMPPMRAPMPVQPMPQMAAPARPVPVPPQMSAPAQSPRKDLDYDYDFDPEEAFEDEGSYQDQLDDIYEAQERMRQVPQRRMPYPDPYAYPPGYEEEEEEDEDSGKKGKNRFGKFLLGLEMTLTVTLLVLVMILNILPLNILLLGGGILLVYWLLMLCLQWLKSSRTFGKVLMVLMILVLLVGNVFLVKTNLTFLSMFGHGGDFSAGRNEPFIVYISGNDGYGETSGEGRSDVNILMAVNPETHKIVMITTPRDYYISLPEAQGGGKDKLTHAGNFGIETSEKVLEELYGLEINGYVRINFTGFQNVVDALGGVSVYSEYEFTATSGEHFVSGYNQVNGTEALAFVRERYAFSQGDFQRGRNQMAMIKAIIQKATSPAILTSYMGLLDSVSSCVLTNVPQSAVVSILKGQLANDTEWQITSMEVKGTGDYRVCYSVPGTELSVVIPDMDSVAEAKAMLEGCLRGE